jgi:Fe2+ or Zn2+ uptake regulation protein
VSCDWSQNEPHRFGSPLLRQLTLRGIRITGYRKILVEAIQDSDRHLDAARPLELARERDQRINCATVYRTLGCPKSCD